MDIINEKEVIINGIIYIEKTFKNGAVIRYVKPSENITPEPTEPTPTMEDKINYLFYKAKGLVD